MALRYILGRASAAGTDYIINEIAACLKTGDDRPLYLLVPEQFTLESEKNLIKGIGTTGIMQAEVLSFNRLAFKVLNEAGGKILNPLNEQGKNMILKKIIDESSHDLQAFSGVSRQTGFVDIVSGCLSDFKMNNIDTDTLQQFIDTLPPERLLTGKLNDLLLIFSRFDDYLQDNYMDMEDYINLVTDKIDETSFLKGSMIWIDKFDKFSPQLLKMVAKIAGLSEQLTVSLTMSGDLSDRDREIFKVSRQTYEKLHHIALAAGIEEEIINLSAPEHLLPRKEEMLFLEKELFAYPYHKFTQPVNNLQVFAAANVKSEVENMTAAIVSLVRDHHFRYRDITVVCTDMERYSSLIRQVFMENDIPYFMDEKRGIMNNPIIESILSALQIMIKGYQYKDVFRYLKAGFSSLDKEQCDELENYVLRYGIRGSIWKKPFTIENGEDLEEINRGRQLFIKPLADLEKKVKGKKDYRELVTAFFEYLEDIKLREKLEDYIEELTEEKLYEYVNENTQIWNIVMMILDQIVEYLGGETADLKQFHDLLEAGFSSFQIGIIPTTVDEVMVGSVNRSKSFGTKAIFIIGANDGLLPVRPAEHKLLSEDEVLSLKDFGIDLGFDFDYRSVEENFNIYLTFAKASDYLWISYALTDEEGKPLHQSMIIDRLRILFPTLAVKREKFLHSYKDLNMISTPRATFNALILNLKDYLEGSEMDEYWWDVYDWYMRQEEWQDKIAAVLQGFDHNNQQERIDDALAKSLYKAPLKASISRLEKFNGCQFAHFIQYGLRPQERKIFSVGAPDIGELFHQGLACFAQKLKAEKIQWKDLEKEACHGLMDQVMDELAAAYNDGVLYSSHRYSYLVKRLKRICRRAAWTLTLHIKRGEFVPAWYEVSFGINGVLPPIEVKLDSGDTVYLEGRIDRVDLLEELETTYVKIIDYKSGYKDIDLSDIYNGFSLQLIIYLYSVLQAGSVSRGKQVKPAGIFYFKIDDPMIETETEAMESIENDILKKLKMAGLVLKDADMVRRLDREIHGYSDIIPVQIKNDGNISDRPNVLDEKEFAALINHVNQKVKLLSEEILDGKTRIEPAKSGNENACQYCPYKGICQFDILFNGNRFRFIRKLDKKEILQKIAAEGGNG